jgi:HK97 family phage major capsid protein/HK97 family phage prohead protease
MDKTQLRAEIQAGSTLQRSFLVEKALINDESRTVTLAFASETPYERYWGIEVLECTPNAMRQQRLFSGANLLLEHCPDDVVGVVESVEIGADRVARAVVRFGKSAKAEEVYQDVKDGIRRNVSVGYMIHQAQLVGTKDGLDTYRVTDWEPFEVSLVSIPADPTVGVGRSMTKPSDSTPPIQLERTIMEPTAQAAQAEPKIIVAEQRNHAAEISKIAATIPGGADLAMRAIQEGQTVEQFQQAAIRAMANKPVPTADIGMSEKEVRQYSVLRAINALSNPTDQAAQRAAQFERECSDAVSAKMGKSSRGLYLPFDVQKRDLTVGTAAAGGNTVATNLLAGDFISALRNAMVLTGLGVRTLAGLTGQVAIPKQAGAATAYWVAENTGPTESQQSFGQVTMSPKTVGAFTDISRRLLLQSSMDVESFVQNDLATVLGLAIQQAAISGTGAANQPTGILTAIAPIVIGGANGLAPTYQNIIDLESAVAVANADIGSMGYLTNAKMRGRLKSTQKFTGTNGMPIWDGGNTPVNGYQAAVTNGVPGNLTKGTSNGVCSAILFGNFADLIIGMWGTLDLMVDPYSGSTAGTVRVVALQDVDIAIRNIESFATMTDAL